VEGLLQTLGLTGVSKSEVSRICTGLDEQVTALRGRRLEGRYPYVWLDARYEKVRVDGRVLSQAVVIAYGVKETEEREALGVDVGPSEDAGFWGQFLRSLVGRGLSGVQLVISDAHAGLTTAIREVLVGATWQRCRVHFMRNVLALVPKKVQAVLSVALRTIVAQPSQALAREELGKVARSLAKKHPRVTALLEEACEDVVAYMGFPSTHWR
jgi:transposase-like protein